MQVMADRRVEQILRPVPKQDAARISKFLEELEFDIFGDFTCDLANGDSTSKTFFLVEFEDAGPDSLFITKRG
jgi:hypothetical protein